MMLEKLAKKALLKQSFAKHIEKLAKPMPMAPAPAAPQPANYKPGNLPKPKPGHVPWYKSPTAKAVGTGLSIASMAIPWTWAGRGLVGLGMLARGGSLLGKGKKAVQIGSQLKRGQSATQAVNRGNQLRRTGAETMRKGQKLKDLGGQFMGTKPVNALKFNAKSPKTYPGAALNTLTAPGGKGVIGTGGAVLGASYYGPQLYNQVTGGGKKAPGTPPSPPPPPGPVPPTSGGGALPPSPSATTAPKMPKPPSRYKATPAVTAPTNRYRAVSAPSGPANRFKATK